MKKCFIDTDAEAGRRNPDDFEKKPESLQMTENQ